MRIIVFLSVVVLGGVVTLGCGDDPFDIQEEELLVVRAFLYAGEPVEEVEITLPTALNSEAEPDRVSDASVSLIRDGVVYGLEPTLGSPGFYSYPGTDLVVAPGDIFDLSIQWGAESVEAWTVVPDLPEGLSLSSDVMEIPEFGGGPGFGGGRFADPLVVRWENPDGSHFFLVVDNIEEDPDPLPTTELFVNRPIRFTSQPVRSDSMFVNAMTLTHYGAHVLTLYSVNQEYADLYEGREQDTRDLNEPPTNIDGGLGVFSAFAGRKALFVAVPEG